MRRAFGVVVLVASLVTLAVLVIPAMAAAPASTQECHKVKVCVHVVGPWVKVPATGEATFLLECPKRQGSVGGTDARASSTDIRVWWDAQVGAPVSQGITTGSFLLFHAVSAGGKEGTFEPLLGCIPIKKQSSSRSTVSARAARIVSPPGTPIGVPLDPRATVVVLASGSTQKTTVTCPKKEHLVGSWNALAFGSKTPPNLGAVASISIKTSVEGSSAKGVIDTANGLSLTDSAEVQIGAVCA